MLVRVRYLPFSSPAPYLISPHSERYRRTWVRGASNTIFARKHVAEEASRRQKGDHQHKLGTSLEPLGSQEILNIDGSLMKWLASMRLCSEDFVESW